MTLIPSPFLPRLLGMENDTRLAVPSGDEITRIEKGATVSQRIYAVRRGGLRYDIGSVRPFLGFTPDSGRLPGCPAFEGMWAETRPQILAWVREHGIVDAPSEHREYRGQFR